MSEPDDDTAALDETAPSSAPFPASIVVGALGFAVGVALILYLDHKTKTPCNCHDAEHQAAADDAELAALLDDVTPPPTAAEVDDALDRAPVPIRQTLDDGTVQQLGDDGYWHNIDMPADGIES